MIDHFFKEISSLTFIPNKMEMTLNYKLKNPIPSYVLCCLPAIATMGAAPYEELIAKIFWLVICLSNPFLGLYYTCNIKINEIVVFWLSKENFRRENGNKISYRPAGHHAMLIEPEDLDLLKDCVANASVLERWSSLAAAYYMIIGIIIGAAGAIYPQISDICVEWTYILLLLAWTLPAIYRRIVHGKALIGDPRKKASEIKIHVRNISKEDKVWIHVRVVITAISSIVVPWLTVLLAYFIPPIGFFCRSKYLAIVCTIWSLNSIIAYTYHLLLEEKYNFIDYIIYIWFTIWGLIVAALLLFLALLNNNQSWWLVFGESCDISTICPI
jgi:hypothetical protein